MSIMHTSQSTNLSLKYSMLKMSLMHTLQLEITNISLKSKKIVYNCPTLSQHRFLIKLKVQI